MKVEDNHYKYRIETKDSNGSVIDFVDIDTVEPLRCAYDVQDELNLETNEHIKRVEEIILNADSTEFWYVDEDRSTDTHLVCYFEEVQLMANANHPMVDTDRSLFEYGKINANEYQDTNFICTHVMPNGVSRIYMSIDKDQLLYQTYTNETIKEYIAQNPITIWYAIRYPVSIPRSMSKGHLLTLDGQTDVSISTSGKEVGLPLVKFNIGETEYNVDNKTLSIKNTTEGAQIRNIVLEGNTPINYARGNGVNTTEATSDSRYDFDPFYDGQTTIQGTVEGGYVGAKLYGDTMVNIAKPYGETPLLTATNANTLCDDLLGMNEEDVKLVDGEITEGRIYGDSIKTAYCNVLYKEGIINEQTGAIANPHIGCHSEKMPIPNRTFIFTTPYPYSKVIYFDSNDTIIKYDWSASQVKPITSTPPENASYLIFGADNRGGSTEEITYVYEDNGETVEEFLIYEIQSVVNPSVEFSLANPHANLFDKTKSVPKLLNASTGELGDNNSDYPTSDFIEVHKDFEYVFNQSRGGSELCYYDVNKVFLSGERNYETKFTPTQDGYVRFVFNKNVMDTLELTAQRKPNPTTFSYTLNKLPNGVADYIDVVNKVHVQRVGIQYIDGSKMNQLNDWRLMVENETTLDFRHGCMGVIGKNSGVGICDKMRYISDSNLLNEGVRVYHHTSASEWILIINKDKLADYTVNSFKQYMASNPITVLYELATPIYTPLTDEEIAQLPLSAYADGCINLSSDQLMPSFEFRMRASNRYQVDMLETGYYYLNAPVGGVKLGTANVDVQQMPCIVKVDNVGTGDSGYRLGFSGNIMYTDVTSTFGGFITINGTIITGGEGDSYTDFIKVKPKRIISATTYIETPIGRGYGVIIGEYDSNKNFIKINTTEEKTITTTTTDNTYYIRVSYRCGLSDNIKKIKIGLNPFITLAKLPSHRIPTSFTQGMKCGNDFGYWEGIKESVFNRLWSTDSNWGMYDDIKLSSEVKLNRIEYGNTIVEDEFDIATGKFTKRVGKYTINGNSNLWAYDISKTETSTHMSFCCSQIPNFKKGGRCIGFLGLNYGAVNSTNSYECWNNLGVSNNLYFRFRKDRYSYYGDGVDGVKAYFNANPTTIYYELEVPEISYLVPTKNIVKTATNGKSIQINKFNDYLTPQVKPSHLTYPVPSLVGNRTYTVVHNRKNIAGSTKPITLDLGGTQVELNDASSKTLVKTPSSLKHNSLIFTGGESTVDHVMVLDGDWTNKPIEYFENMMGHDTDAIITIIGNGQIDDVEEQYLW